MSKFEKLLDLLVNEQKDEAEKLFHEIVVEKSRSIYEGILADEEAEATEDVSEAGRIGEIGDATAENAAKLCAEGAGQIFTDAGLAEAGSEGFLNPIMDGVGLVTGIAGLLMGSGLFNKKPPAPPKPPPIQDVSVVAGATGEGQI